MERSSLAPCPAIQCALGWARVIRMMARARAGRSSSSQSAQDTMTQLMRFPGAVTRDPAIDAWLEGQERDLGVSAKRWFEVMRASGADVRELLHDGHPTACVTDAAFGYVNVFRAHVNVGFFRGAVLADPRGLLEGTGKFMRHVKLRPGIAYDAAALAQLIAAAYADMKERVRAEALSAGFDRTRK